MYDGESLRAGWKWIQVPWQPSWRPYCSLTKLKNIAWKYANGNQPKFIFPFVWLGVFAGGEGMEGISVISVFMEGSQLFFFRFRCQRVCWNAILCECICTHLCFCIFVFFGKITVYWNRHLIFWSKSWWKYQKLIWLSIVDEVIKNSWWNCQKYDFDRIVNFDENINFDKNINFDENINLTKISIWQKYQFWPKYQFWSKCLFRQYCQNGKTFRLLHVSHLPENDFWKHIFCTKKKYMLWRKWSLKIYPEQNGQSLSNHYT